MFVLGVCQFSSAFHFITGINGLITLRSWINLSLHPSATSTVLLCRLIFLSAVFVPFIAVALDSFFLAESLLTAVALVSLCAFEDRVGIDLGLKPFFSVIWSFSE